MNGDDDSFLIKNMEAFVFTVLDSGKGHIDPENLKKMGGRRNFCRPVEDFADILYKPELELCQRFCKHSPDFVSATFRQSSSFPITVDILPSSD